MLQIKGSNYIYIHKLYTVPTAHYFYYYDDDVDDDDDIIRINNRSNKILIKTTKQLNKQLHCRADAFELANV